MSDLVALRDCPNELTGKDDSVHSSTCFDSSNVVSSLRSQIAEQERHAEWNPWTNEKHSLYLDSLEMSFINELQHSVYSYNLFVREKNYRMGSDSHNCPRQFVRDGQYQNAKFKGNEAWTESTADSPFILNNTRVHHSLSSAKIPIMAAGGGLGECREEQCVTGNLTTSYTSARNSQHLPSAKHRFQDYVSSTEEVSDQNFEDVESDTHWRLLECYMINSKRRATANSSSIHEKEWFNRFGAKE